MTDKPQTTTKRHNRLAFHNNKWGYKGVEYHARKEKFKAVIWHNWPHRMSLGFHDTAEQAARAYDDGARKFYGAEAYLNFPRDGEKQVTRSQNNGGTGLCVKDHSLSEHGYVGSRGTNCRLCNTEAAHRYYHRKTGDNHVEA